jgi:DNA-binding IclR family transcriptional regulator
VLTTQPRKLSDLARAAGGEPADGTVRRALEALKDAGQAEKTGRGLWRLKPIGAVA